MIEFIVFSLSILLLLAYKTLGKNLSRPSILYIGGFLICSIVAYSWKEEWGLEKMESGTVFMIVGGALLFYLVELYDYKKHPLLLRNKCFGNDSPIKILPIKLILFFFFQLLAYYLMARANMNYAKTEDLSSAMAEVNNDQQFDGIVVRLPWYVTNSYFICRYVGYIWCILLPYYQFQSSRYNTQKILIALNFVASLVGALSAGGRTVLAYYIISYVSCFYICYQFKNRWKGGFLPKKIMIILVIIGAMFIVSFKFFASVVGRETDKALGLYFSIYCGAQIKNFDDYIREPFKQDNSKGVFAQYTISKIYNEIAERQGSSQSRQFSAELPFNSYGEYPLGNVYTTYYNYYADFGYWGILCAGAMAFILALLYRKMMKSTFWRSGRLNLWIIVYNWLSVTAFLCFFGNAFWGNFAIVGSIKAIIVWWFMIYYLQGKGGNQRNHDVEFSKKDDTNVERLNTNE